MGEAWDPVAEYKERTKRTAAWFERACKSLPGGVTGNVKFFPPYPVYAKRAKGSHLWDLDGNEYIDYMLCFGPLVLGHGHPKVLEAVRRQLESGGTPIFGAPHELEVEVAERLKRIFPFTDAVRYTNSGLEATLHALRIARGFTGRSKIAKFEGHYHGSYDEVLVSLAPPVAQAGPRSSPVGVPESVSTTPRELEETIVLPFNDASNTERILRANQEDLAAVIVEPVQRGFIPAEPGFLETLREITEELGIVLIFDEIMSGFRMERPGGAATLLGIEPDILTLGKVLGGGFPIGAFLGKREFLEVVNPATRPKERRVFHAGTFNGHPTILAAGLATLDVLEEPGTYLHLNRITSRLRDGLNELFDRVGLEGQALGPGSTFNVLFAKGPVRDYRDAMKADGKRRALFDYGLLARGIHLHPDKPFYTSTAHSEADVEMTLRAAEEVLRRIR